MSPWNDDALASLKEKLKLNVLTKPSLSDKLERPAGGFMDRGEAQTVRALPSDSEQMDKVIDILRGKGDEDFDAFCNILRKSNYGNWADELVSEAKRFKLKRQADRVQRGEGRGTC